MAEPTQGVPPCVQRRYRPDQKLQEHLLYGGYGHQQRQSLERAKLACAEAQSQKRGGMGSELLLGAAFWE